MRRQHFHCTFDGCARPHEAKGFCNLHYIRLRTGKPLDDPLKLAASPHLPICPYCRGRVRGSHLEDCRRRSSISGRVYRKEHMREWAAYSKEYRKRPLVRAKYLANKKLQWAVSTGQIKKPKRCEDCRKVFLAKGLHGHHEDYLKPLNVSWVCDPCHKARHLARKA